MANIANLPPPDGCGSDVTSLYFNLCDKEAVWGIVLEALASAGVLFCIVLFIALLASVPFTHSKNRRSSIALSVFFLVCVCGLFCLTFAYVVKKDFSTCAARRFLWGALFAGCFSCLLMQAVRLNVLSRHDASPRAWLLGLGALGLWMVEVIINTEWLIITIDRHPVHPPSPFNQSGNISGVPAHHAIPCNITNDDFVMALIYVLALLLSVLLASLTAFCGKFSQWKKDAAFIFVASFLSVGIWVAWIVMYLRGNSIYGKRPQWDDPTLAVALVANAWVFLFFYSIPEICHLTTEDEVENTFAEDRYPNRGVGYETILKEQQQPQQNMFMENKAFSMDEPSHASKPLSPYSGYTGQLRGSVYQPTELTMIGKVTTEQQQPPVDSFDLVIPRASSTHHHHSTSDSENSSTMEEAVVQYPPYRPHTQPSPFNNNGGNGLNRMSQW